ncbi:hypothetical protein K402DRAFT_390085 [Aulographum hederae CBS 113979]|uniref:Uncharacterized protein n=1 Tax=Aulographum hederae CBS 113979 TaxID=1176131 RepID=A0A6G1HBZ5_9PEZI|nr:hypothetical protein K402DRAFT_390085 [Aulographum hederae CBS 113979]
MASKTVFLALKKGLRKLFGRSKKEVVPTPAKCSSPPSDETQTSQSPRWPDFSDSSQTPVAVPEILSAYPRADIEEDMTPEALDKLIRANHTLPLIPLEEEQNIDLPFKPIPSKPPQLPPLNFGYGTLEAADGLLVPELEGVSEAASIASSKGVASSTASDVEVSVAVVQQMQRHEYPQPSERVGRRVFREWKPSAVGRGQGVLVSCGAGMPPSKRLPDVPASTHVGMEF